jgi:hypothetical protein
VALVNGTKKRRDKRPSGQDRLWLLSIIPLNERGESSRRGWLHAPFAMMWAERRNSGPERTLRDALCIDPHRGKHVVYGKRMIVRLVMVCGGALCPYWQLNLSVKARPYQVS